MIISRSCPPNTEVHVCLVVGKKWVDHDPKYVPKCVKPLEQAFAKETWESEFPNYDCQIEYLDPEDKEQNTLWLLERLLSFFKEGPNRRAFVDLTSAPREWVYSAFDVSSFFSNLKFYYVKSARTKLPSQYDVPEKMDQGTVLDYPVSGSLEPPLSRWLRPYEEDAKEESVQYQILKLMYEMALEQKKDLSDLQELTIDGLRLAERARSDLPYYEGTPLEDVQKGMTRYMRDIDRFEIFKRRKPIIVGRRGIVLMRGLFGKKETERQDSDSRNTTNGGVAQQASETAERH